jgi:hypothetical protein
MLLAYWRKLLYSTPSSVKLYVNCSDIGGYLPSADIDFGIALPPRDLGCYLVLELRPLPARTMAVLTMEEEGAVFVLPHAGAGLVAAGVFVDPRANNSVFELGAVVEHLGVDLYAGVFEEFGEVELLPVVGAAARGHGGGGGTSTP